MNHAIVNVTVSTPSEGNALLPRALRLVIEQGIAAIEQSSSGIPDEIRDFAKSMQVSVSESLSETSVKVKHWGSYGDDQSEFTHQFDLDDQRSSNGQAYLSLGAVEGKIDDMLSSTFEVNSNPLDETDAVPCMHVHFNDDCLAMSLFKIGDKILLRPENGVELELSRPSENRLNELMYWIK